MLHQSGRITSVQYQRAYQKLGLEHTSSDSSRCFKQILTTSSFPAFLSFNICNKFVVIHKQKSPVVRYGSNTKLRQLQELSKTLFRYDTFQIV